MSNAYFHIIISQDAQIPAVTQIITDFKDRNAEIPIKHIQHKQVEI